MIKQRSRGQYFSLQLSIGEFNRKITIEEYASQSFCTGEIENVTETLKIYEDFERKIPLDWPLCMPEIMTI